VMDALREDGLIENTVDVMDALLVALTMVVGLRSGDLVAAQLVRHQKNRGTLGFTDAMNIKNLMDAFARIVKVSNELKDNAVLSKRARKEFGDVRGNTFQTLMAEVLAGESVPPGEDMTPFYAASVVKPRDADEAQFTMLVNGPADQSVLTAEEEVELMAVTPHCPPVNGGREDG